MTNLLYDLILINLTTNSNPASHVDYETLSNMKRTGGHFNYLNACIGNTYRCIYSMSMHAQGAIEM